MKKTLRKINLRDLRSIVVLGCIAALISTPVFADTGMAHYTNGYAYVKDIVSIFFDLGAVTCALTCMRSIFNIMVNSSNKNTEEQMGALKAAVVGLFVLNMLPFIITNLINTIDGTGLDIGMTAPGDGL